MNTLGFSEFAKKHKMATAWVCKRWSGQKVKQENVESQYVSSRALGTELRDSAGIVRVPFSSEIALLTPSQD